MLEFFQQFLRLAARYCFTVVAINSVVITAYAFINLLFMIKAVEIDD
jgi:hypothetical protein